MVAPLGALLASQPGKVEAPGATERLLKLLRELGIDLAALVPSATETHLPSGGIEIEGYEL